MQARKGLIVTLILWIAILLPVLGNLAVAESAFDVESTSLQVYRDGLVHIKQLLSVNQLASSISVELLSDSVENLLIIDENKMLVDYAIDGSNITVYSLGEQQITIDYDTLALTKKEAETWTLLTDSSYSLTVILPANSTLLYFSKMPSAVNTVNNEISLTLSQGNWEISYTLPLITQETSKESANTNESTDSTPLFNPLLILPIAAATGIGVSAFVLAKRHKKPSIKRVLKTNPLLQPDDQKIIEFLIEKNGKAFEAEIRERFPDMPRTSLWRLVRRLERLEIVEINKIGLENQVKLKK